MEDTQENLKPLYVFVIGIAVIIAILGTHSLADFGRILFGYAVFIALAASFVFVPLIRRQFQLARFRVHSIDDFLSLLVEIKSATVDEFEGCSELEISQLMDAQGVSRIPPLYHDLLRALGKRAGSFMTGEHTSFYFDDVLDLKADATSYVQTYQQNIPKTAFVFWAYKSIDKSQFEYFDTDQGDNPPIYTIFENGEIDISFEHFSDWLTEGIYFQSRQKKT